jgi:hypothetical protein
MSSRILLILFLLGMIVLVITALILLAWLEKKLRRRRFRVELANTGNAQSRYALRVDDPSGLLQSEFRINQMPLAQRSESLAIVKVGEPIPVTPIPQANAPYNPRSNKSGALNFGMTIAGLFTGLFSTLGALLPGELGSALFRLSGQASQAETQARRVQSLGEQSTYLKDTVTTPQEQPVYAQPSPYETAAPAPVTTMGAQMWAETPYIKAGDALKVDLFVTPLKRLTTLYSFGVVSKTAEQSDVSPITEQGNIAGGSFLGTVLPWLMVVGAFFIVVLAVLVGMAIAGRLG